MKYDLNLLKQVFITPEKLTMTVSAMQSQYELNFTDQDVVDAIQSINLSDFYKSMPPTHPGFSAWQDVYKSSFNNIKLYIKFQIDFRGEVIVSFKAR